MAQETPVFNINVNALSNALQQATGTVASSVAVTVINITSQASHSSASGRSFDR